MPINTISRMRFSGGFGMHFLLEMVPRSAVALDDPEYEDFAPGAITVTSPDLYGWRDYPIGFQSTPVVKITTRSWLLTADQRTYVQNYRLIGGGTVTGSTEFDYDLHTLWRLYLTDAEGTIERVIFEGTQRANPAPDIEITVGYGATATYELHDVVKTSFEQVSGQALADRIKQMDRSDVDGVDWSIFKAYCDIAWTNNGYRFALFGNGGVEGCPLGFLFDALADVASQVYAGHCRTEASINFKSIDGGGAGSTVQATPWDHWRFYKQIPNSAGTAGDILTAREVGFIGRIGLALDGSRNAGLLYPGQDSFGGKWTECYSMLSQMIESAWGRGVVQRFEAGVVKVWWLGPNQTIGVPQTFDKAWLLTGTTGQLGKYKFKGSTPTIGQVDASLFGAMSKDQRSWKKKGVDGGKNFTCKVVFDNHPRISDDSELTTTMVNMPSGPQQRRIYYSNISPWKFVYIEPDVHGQEFITRVHPAVKINVGDNDIPLYANLGGYGPELPDYTGVEDPSMFDDLRSRLAPVQGEGAYVAALISTALSYTGSPLVSTYTFSAPLSIYYLYENVGAGIGCTWMLPEDGNGNRRAGSLVSETDASLLWYGIGVLATVKPDLAAGTAELTFIAVR